MTPFATFAALHVPGDPLILVNAWDVGSARAVAGAGAKAIATGSASVAGANGYADGEAVPLDLVLGNLERIVRAVDLPVSLDFEGGYAVAPGEVAANAVRVRDAGAVGINIEDQIVGGEGLHGTGAQADRIAAIRAAVGSDFFINARTDLFLKRWGETFTDNDLDAAAIRAEAYAQAGASGFFAPGLAAPAQMRALAEAIALPLNVMAFPGAPDSAALAAAKIARISHGPFPWRAAMAGVADAAKAALAR